MVREKLMSDKIRNKEILQRHINENKLKQLKETIESKKYKRTNYGPEETDYTYIINMQK